MSFAFLFRGPTWKTTLRLVMTLGLLRPLCVVQLFRLTLYVAGTGQVCFRLSLMWALLDAFLKIRQGLCVFERKTTEIKCYSHSSVSRVHIVRTTDPCRPWPCSPHWGPFLLWCSSRSFCLTALCHPVVRVGSPPSSSRPCPPPGDVACVLLLVVPPSAGRRQWGGHCQHLEGSPSARDTVDRRVTFPFWPCPSEVSLAPLRGSFPQVPPLASSSWRDWLGRRCAGVPPRVPSHTPQALNVLLLHVLPASTSLLLCTFLGLRYEGRDARAAFSGSPSGGSTRQRACSLFPRDAGCGVWTRLPVRKNEGSQELRIM